MMEVIDPCLSGVQVLWWDPFGAAVFAFAGGPAALLDEAVVRSTGQGEVIDVGFAVVGDPVIDVVDLTPVSRCGATRAGTAALECMQHDALPGSRETFGAAAVERLAGVFVVDHQVVVRLG